MWHLFKIPKILNVYWGGGNLSKLRYLTIETFLKYNPDWEIKFYYPNTSINTHTWATHEQKYNENWTDWRSQINGEIVHMINVNFDDVMSNMSDVHRSDNLRWRLLSEEGGVWADMDILFFKSMDELLINKPENKDKETVVCINHYGHSIGFMMGCPNNSTFEKMAVASLDHFSAKEYQCMGSILFNKLFPTVESIPNAVNLGMEAVYYHDASNVAKIYSSLSVPKDIKGAIGVHWYAGHKLSGDFLISTKGGEYNIPNNMLGRLISEHTTSVIKDKFTNIYQTNYWKSSETRSGAGSEVKATIHIIKRLPCLFKKYNIRGLIDLGCGDFNWIRRAINPLDLYLGIDIVDDLISINNESYANDKIRFKQGLVQNFFEEYNDNRYSAVLLGDVLVHLSFDDISMVLNNLSKSKIKFMLATHFTEHIKNNNIKTGDWRCLNMTKEPLNLSLPLESIPYEEPYNIGYGTQNDKTLSLWELQK